MTEILALFEDRGPPEASVYWEVGIAGFEDKDVIWHLRKAGWTGEMLDLFELFFPRPVHYCLP